MVSQHVLADLRRLLTKGHPAGGGPASASVPVELVHVDTDHFKSIIYSRYHWPSEDAGAWHVHREFSQAACEQLVSEQLLVLPSGRRRWDAGKRANHLLDCTVLALVQAVRANAETALPTWEEHQAARAGATERASAPRPPGFIRRPDGPFIRR